MNNIDRFTFISELNSKVNHYVNEHHLFSGGCCYTAYCLAAALKHAGIKYRTVVWQYQDILKENNFNKVINGKGVSHVGIEVTVRGEKVIIGDCSGIKEYFATTYQDYRVRKYDNVDPEELLEGYRNNKWNYLYNTSWNKYLARDIRKITTKYAGDLKIRSSYKRPGLEQLFGLFFFGF
jgi:hypothetical protein